MPDSSPATERRGVRLDATQVRRYQADGYAVVHQQVFTPADFSRLRDIFEEHLAQHGERIFDELDMPHVRDERLLRLLLDDAVLDLVEPITGPDIVLWSSGFICKQPFVGPPTPWHEDSAYWTGRLDNDQRIVTVWLALDRTFRENGCMGVIPGSHLGDGAQYRTIDADAFFHSEAIAVDESEAVWFELAPGECSLHDGRILHGAAANTSPHRRAGYTMRYLPAGTRIVPERNPGHRVWLARGRPVAANEYVNA
jgi:ectoine hydroxylase-related dioxygenase (phytanoyl-CoA dioxygenase family)